MQFGSKVQDLLAAIGRDWRMLLMSGNRVASGVQRQFADAAEFFDELRTGDEPNPLQWMNMMRRASAAAEEVLLDLRKANRSQLEAAGVPAKNIFASDLCTDAGGTFCSVIEKKAQSGRMMAVIGIRAKEKRAARGRIFTLRRGGVAFAGGDVEERELAQAAITSRPRE